LANAQEGMTFRGYIDIFRGGVRWEAAVGEEFVGAMKPAVCCLGTPGDDAELIWA